MKRREFITLIGGAATAWPLVARAQEPGRTYRLGVLLPVARDEPAMVAFLDELRLHGFVEGRNLTILPGGLQFRNEQINELVSTMVKAAPMRLSVQAMSAGAPSRRRPKPYRSSS